MKKALYILLLVAELVGGFWFLVLATSVTGWGYFYLVTAVWAALTALLLVKQKKTCDASGKRRIKVAIALVMLLPAAGGLAGLIWFIWGMASAGVI